MPHLYAQAGRSEPATGVMSYYGTVARPSLRA
jgi:hypothetical protein